MPTTHRDTREVPLDRNVVAPLDVFEGLAAFLDRRYPDDPEDLKHLNPTYGRNAIATWDGGRSVEASIEALRSDLAGIDADILVFHYLFRRRGGPLAVDLSCWSTTTEPTVKIVVSDTDQAVVQGLLHVLEAEAKRITRNPARRVAESESSVSVEVPSRPEVALAPPAVSASESIETAPPASATRPWYSTLLDHPMGATVIGTLLAAGILTLIDRVFG